MDTKPPFLQPLDTDAASIYTQYFNSGKDDAIMEKQKRTYYTDDAFWKGWTLK